MKGMATLMMNDNITRKVEDAFGLGCPTLRYALDLAVCRFALFSAFSGVRYKYLDIVVYRLFNMPVEMRWVGFPVSGSHIATIDYNAQGSALAHPDHQLRPTCSYISHSTVDPSQRICMTGSRILLSLCHSNHHGPWPTRTANMNCLGHLMY